MCLYYEKSTIISNRILVRTVQIKENFKIVLLLNKSKFLYPTVCNCTEIKFHYNIICISTTQHWSRLDTVRSKQAEEHWHQKRRHWLTDSGLMEMDLSVSQVETCICIRSGPGALQSVQPVNSHLARTLSRILFYCPIKTV